MSDGNFRRELNDAFDAISGSPSPALPDRVRSSLLEGAPERRGPFWIAGLAAAVMAAVIIGILFVANPGNRPANVVPGGTNPTPSASPSPTASTSPDTNLPPFVCASSAPITSPQAPAVAFIDGLRTGTHTGYDRLTVEFNNGQPSSIELRPQSGTTFTRSPRGDTVTLAGRNGILVTIHGADAHTAYTGATDITTSYPSLVEVRVVQDFEGVVQLGLGISGPACYRAFILTSPTRLVIDIQAG
ncbi:hypothetical protein EPN29_02615 [bacterium]|nr:MAG: hypothetical protein EPN29_02615 [bacterium]